MMTEKNKYFFGVSQSALGQAWVDSLDVQGANQALAISQKYGVVAPLARLLSARAIDESDVLDYLNPTLKRYMPDPMQFTDMEKATERLVTAIENKEQVAIFGDYDVDGACSSAILYKFLQFFQLRTKIYIPDRLVEGYGPNPTAMRMLAKEGASLIVTVDCGANSPEAIRAAREAGSDVIVLDHHQMKDIHTEANALVNPNRPDDRSNQGHLCAAGVVFTTIAWVCRLLRQKAHIKNVPEILEYLDLVALATICDVVPLTGVNRAFVKKGLQVARSMHNPGIAALSRASRVGEPLNVFHLGFLLGPRINAGGRIGDPALGARLLTCQSIEDANVIADKLNELNQERQEMEATQLTEAETIIESLKAITDLPKVIVVAHSGWHPGIVGIVAARLKEKFHCPAFAIALNKDGVGAGSGRSISGINLGEIVSEAVDMHLLEKGGGHAMAAGITISETNIAMFQKWLEEKLSEKVDELRADRCISIDGVISASGATKNLFETIDQAGPFGASNPTPIFVLPSHRLVDLREVGNGHLSMSLANSEGKRLKAIAFRAVGTPLGDFFMAHLGQSIHVAGNLDLNHWNGSVLPQLRVIDAAVDERRTV